MELRLSVRMAFAALVASTAAVAGPAATGGVPAAAAVPPVTIVEVSGAWDSVASKSATATCPAGTRVIGGGAGNAAGGGVVHLNRLQALGSSNAFTASSTEHGAYAPNWRVDVWAICADLPGVEYVSFSVGANSEEFKSAVAECPAGKQLISTGGRITGGNGQVVLDDMIPSSTFSRVTVTAYEDPDGYSGNWGLFAHGVCADPIAGLELRTDTATPIDSENDIVGATCSAGKQPLGIGASINGGLGRVIYSGVVPSAMTGFAFAQELQPGFAGDWWTRAYAICA